MAATKLGLGERGAIELTPQRRIEGKWRKLPTSRGVERWRARCYYRGHDGVLRELSRIAATKAEAETAVERAFQQALLGNSDELDADTSLMQAGAIWLAAIARSDSGLSAKTVADYGAVWRRVVDADGSRIRGLTLGQANNPQRLTAFLRDIAERHGTGSAKMARSALSGVLRLAVSANALERNALREVGRVQAQAPKPVKRSSGQPRDTDRAFTRAERDSVVAHADALAGATGLNPRTRRKREAVADLIGFLSGTGVRIAEARHLIWTDVDLADGRVRINGTKSASAQRTLDLPHWLTNRIRERAERVGATGYVFGSPHHTNGTNDIEWAQSNLARNVAAVLTSAGHSWASPHTFRRTVASLAHAAGVPLVQIADQLGHADPAMTASVYLGREPHGDRSALAAHL